jgi:hypothetical protein
MLGNDSPAYINFQLYILWKAVLAEAPDPLTRRRLVQRAGALAAEQLDGPGLAALRREAAAAAGGGTGPAGASSATSTAATSSQGRAPWPVVRASLERFLGTLFDARFILGYEVISGATPSISNPQEGGGAAQAVTALDASSSAEGQQQLGPGDVFQVREGGGRARKGGAAPAHWGRLFSFSSSINVLIHLI